MPIQVINSGGSLKVVSGPAWRTQAFSAGDYTTDVSTWVVASGDVVANTYKVIDGNTLIWSIAIAATSTLGAGNSFLFIKLPGGLSTTGVYGGNAFKPAYLYDNGTVHLDGVAHINDATHIVIHRGGVVYTAGSLSVYVTMILPI
jgi:hypothetical protein